MPRLKLIHITGPRDIWEVERITSKKFTPDKFYLAPKGDCFISQEKHFVSNDIKKILKVGVPFGVKLLKK